VKVTDPESAAANSIVASTPIVADPPVPLIASSTCSVAPVAASNVPVLVTEVPVSDDERTAARLDDPARIVQRQMAAKPVADRAVPEMVLPGIVQRLVAGRALRSLPPLA